MKIVQISQGDRGIIGLSDDGDIYQLVRQYKSRPKTEEELKAEQDSGYPFEQTGEHHELIGEKWEKIEVMK